MSKTILIVDDQKAVRMVAVEALKGLGYELLTAEDGEEAWRIVQESQPQVVLSDWQMPKMTGPKLIKLIEKEYPETKCVLMTGNSAREVALLGMQVPVVFKPFNLKELEALIRGILLEAK